MSRPIPITADELARLIRAQAKPENHEAVSCQFGGPTGSQLQPNETPWALPLLAKWRGVSFEEGAGI